MFRSYAVRPELHYTTRALEIVKEGIARFPAEQSLFQTLGTLLEPGTKDLAIPTFKVRTQDYFVKHEVCKIWDVSGLHRENQAHIKMQLPTLDKTSLSIFSR